jgi:multiple sugar transport system substrate-binding protein
MSDIIEFLAWSRTDQDMSALKEAIARFESRHTNLTVQTHSPQPEMMWTEIVKTALYGDGADIGEVGSTYISSLAGMNALRPFSLAEVASLGGSLAFIEPLWLAGYSAEDTRPWAIPWTADTRAIYYRRDLLQKAGIDEASAFQNFENFTHTLRTLQAAGVEVPLTMSTTSSQVLTPFAASWIWEADGGFIHPDLRSVAFDAPEARRGLQAYFSLGKYLAPSARRLDSGSSDRLFCGGNAAVCLSGCWMLEEIDTSGTPEVKENTGVAPMTGVPFIGGTHLVIWKHCVKEHLALDLIRHLTDSETLLGLPRNLLIPARLDVLNAPHLVSPSFQYALNQSVKRGRSFPALTVWGLVEDRFGQMLAAVWSALADHPDAGVKKIVDQYIDALASRLNITLSSGR